MRRILCFLASSMLVTFCYAKAENTPVFEIDIPITDETILCSGELSLLANDIESYVDGKYPNHEFKSNLVENSCFYKNFLIEKAFENGGKMTASIKVSKRNVREPIYACDPPPCSFCDPGECRIVGHDEYIRESVSINVYGLKFYGSSKLD